MSANRRAVLPLERPGRPAPPALAALRQALAEAAAKGVWLTDPPPREQAIGGVRALCFAPPGPARGTLVHFHGGGFRQGSPEMVGPLAVALAERCRIKVICPAYRLAPEHPLPAALNDGLNVIHALCGEVSSLLILCGDSAGGGLAASLTALAIAEQLSLAGLVLLSPWLDLTVTSSCYATNALSDPVFSREAAKEAADQYLQGCAAEDPVASPLFAKLAGFPPTFVSVGAGEVLADDSRRLHAALRDAGVDAELSVTRGMEHTAVVRGPALTGSAETFDAVATFIDRLLASPSTR